MGQNVSIDFIARTGGAIRDINKLNRAVGTQATKMEKVRAGVRRMTPVAIAGGAALVGFGVKAVAAASDVSESINKASTIYGKSSQAIIDASKNAATEVGLSQGAYLEGVSTLGQFGKAAGLTGDDLSKFGTDFATLSADLASFNNTSPEEALEAIGATLRGETEPIRKYGVMINDAALKQKAMEMGIYDGNGALNQQQKTMAASKLIMEQTKDAQGDFAKTSGGLANSQRILKAQFTDFMATLGAGLLPIVEKVMAVLNKLTTWAREHPGIIKAVIAVFAGFITTVLALNVAFKLATATQKAWIVVTNVAKVAQKGLNAVMRANPLGIVITLIAAVAAALVIAYKKSETFRNFVDALWGTIKTVFSAIKDAAIAIYEDGIKPLWDGAKEAFEAIGTIIETLYDNVIKPWWDQVKAIFDLFISLLKGDFKGAWDAAKRVVSTAIGNIKTYIFKIPGFLTSVLAKIPSAALKIGKAILKGIKDGLVGLADWIWEQIKGLPGRLAREIVSKVPGLGKTLPEGYKNPFLPGGPANPRSLQPMGRSTVNVNVVNGGDSRILVSEEQIARAVYRVLARSDARNGLEFA